ncbi:MAG: hypothetical protein COB20_09810 [SAR86 cluster bacterium]|uniref:DUF1330 domain-containing protein n=1 Tax=SAR86 cluster bacterium TaxID=2030880 RepID=A0A2A4X351_9GAMM|nr:MAG: hypothetical protein COB20_09810 [SAR86 cluster bacterium]
MKSVSAGSKLLLSGITRMGFISLLLTLLFYFSLDDARAAEPSAVTDTSFFMFNALWFKEEGGAAKYAEYLQAAGPFVAKHGGKTDASYSPAQALIGEFDADLVFLIEWPNFAAFTSLIQDPGYLAISHLREEAIRDSLLIRFDKL